MPPPIRKAVLWMVAALLLEIAVAWWVIAAGVGHGLYLIIPMQAPAFGAQIFFIITLTRLGRRLRESGGRLCFACGFDLRGLGNSGVCPECGREFEVHADRERWRAYVNFDRR